jgi:hypothetical protein
MMYTGAGFDLVDVQDTTTNKLVFMITDGCDNEHYKAHTYMFASVYLFVCLQMCVCVCVCV